MKVYIVHFQKPVAHVTRGNARLLFKENQDTIEPRDAETYVKYNKVFCMSEKDWMKVHPHLARKEGSFPKGAAYEEVRRDIIKALHADFLDVPAEEIHVDEYQYSSVPPMNDIVKSVVESLVNSNKNLDKIQAELDALRVLDKARSNGCHHEDSFATITLNDSHTSTFFDENHRCVLPSMWSDTNTVCKDKSSLYIFYDGYAKQVRNVLRQEDATYNGFFQQLFPELTFHDQVYEIDEHDQELKQFIGSRLQHLSRDDLINTDKVDKLMTHVLEAVDVSTTMIESQMNQVLPLQEPGFGPLDGYDKYSAAVNDMFAPFMEHSWSMEWSIKRDKEETEEHFRARVIKQFMDDRVAQANGENIASSILFEEFMKWCRATVSFSDQRLFSKNNFTPTLRYLGYHTKRQPSGVVWLNMQLKSKVNDHGNWQSELPPPEFTTKVFCGGDIRGQPKSFVNTECATLNIQHPPVLSTK